MADKDDVDTIGGAVEMACFCIPGVGEFAAAGVAGGLAVFDMFYDDTSSSSSHFATNEDLDKMVADVKVAMSENDDQVLLSSIRTDMSTFHRTLINNWATLKDEDDLLGLMQLDTPLSDDWAARIRKIKEPIIDPSSDIVRGLQAIILLRPFEIETHKSVQKQTLSLFIYAVNIFILYAKLCLMWEYREILDSKGLDALRKKMKDQIDTKDPALKAATKAWMKARAKALKDGKAAGQKVADIVLPPSPVNMLVEDNIKVNSVFVTALKEGMLGVEDEDDAVGYLDFVVDFRQSIRDHYAAYANDVAAAEARVTIDEYFDVYVDGKFEQSGYSQEVAEGIRDGLVAPLRAESEQTNLVDTGVAIFDDAYLEMVDNVIGHWSFLNESILDFIGQYKSAKQTDQAG